MGEKERITIGVIGFGTVGSGTLKVLWERQAEMERTLNIGIQVKKVVDQDWSRERKVFIPPEMRSTDPGEVTDDPEIDIVVEAIGGVSPAFEFVSRALQRGKSVVIPNKELIAKKGGELLEIAYQNQVDLFFEGAVGGGIPIIHALKEQLVGDDIEEVIGIVNGTTNPIRKASS